MRALKAVADHLTRVPSVTKLGKFDAAMMMVSPSFWRETMGELGLMKEKRGGRGSLHMQIPIRAGRVRSGGGSAKAEPSRMEASGGGRGGYVTPRGGRMSGGGDDD